MIFSAWSWHAWKTPGIGHLGWTVPLTTISLFIVIVLIWGIGVPWDNKPVDSTNLPVSIALDSEWTVRGTERAAKGGYCAIIKNVKTQEECLAWFRERPAEQLICQRGGIKNR